jgi:hypothetical protein
MILAYSGFRGSKTARRELELVAAATSTKNICNLVYWGQLKLERSVPHGGDFNQYLKIKRHKPPIEDGIKLITQTLYFVYLYVLMPLL